MWGSACANGLRPVLFDLPRSTACCGDTRARRGELCRPRQSNRGLPQVSGLHSMGFFLVRGVYRLPSSPECVSLPVALVVCVAARTASQPTPLCVHRGLSFSIPASRSAALSFIAIALLVGILSCGFYAWSGASVRNVSWWWSSGLLSRGARCTWRGRFVSVHLCCLRGCFRLKCKRCFAISAGG